VAGVTLQAARADATAVVAGGYLYVVGGVDPTSGAPLASVERAAIAADGTLGAVALLPSSGTRAPALPAARGRHAGALLSGGGDAQYYVLGGKGASGALTEIVTAPLRAMGMYGNFASAGNLATARDGVASLRVGDVLYVVGGGAASSEALAL